MSVSLRRAEAVHALHLHRVGLADMALWSFAALVVLSLQAGAVYLAGQHRPMPELPGAPPPAIMLELAEIATAPQVEDIAVDDGELSLSQPDSQPAQASPEEAAPTEPPPPDVAEPVEPPRPAEPIEEPAAEPVEEPVTPPPEATPEETPPDMVEVETAAVAVPMPAALPPSITEQRQRFAEQQQREREQRERNRQAQQQQAANQQTAPRSVQAEQSQQMAAPQQTTTTQRTPNISPQQWQGQIIALIERAKRYPNDAQRRREEGVPYLQLFINRDGTIQSSRIARSSGYASLDAAALAIAGRLPRLPAPPAGMQGNPVGIVVLVNFNLR